MKLPNPELAQVETSKVTEYLLCPSHPDGGSKAAFFIRFGFRVEDWQILAEALRGHGTTNPVVKVDGTFSLSPGRLGNSKPRINAFQ
jgi:hypothetical protein